jgi:hypothetical protein
MVLTASPFKAVIGSPFAKRKPDGVPPGLTVKAERRRAAALAEARDVLAHLPGPGEALHALMTGRYDLMHLLLVILNSRPGPLPEMRIATLSYNSRNLAELCHLLDTGKVRRLGFLFSKFFAEHDRPTFTATVREFRARGQRLAAARSHAKVVTMEFADGSKLILEGSANLRTNSNQEQFALIHCPLLHDWHAAWIDAAIATHESDTSDDPGKG